MGPVYWDTKSEEMSLGFCASRILDFPFGDHVLNLCPLKRIFFPSRAIFASESPANWKASSCFKFNAARDFLEGQICKLDAHIQGVPTGWIMRPARRPVLCGVVYNVGGNWSQFTEPLAPPSERWSQILAHALSQNRHADRCSPKRVTSIISQSVPPGQSHLHRGDHLLVLARWRTRLD